MSQIASHEDVAGILSGLTGPSLAVMLYGSRARGDALSDSDVDVLQLSAYRRPAYHVNRLSVTVYTPDHLRAMAQAGSLFILHLRREGVILQDDGGRLGEALQAYVHPVSYEPLKDALRISVRILDVDEEGFHQRSELMTRVALYLLRTALYARCAEMDRPTFSMTCVSEILGDPRIAELFRCRAKRGRDHAYFMELRRMLEAHLGACIHNEEGSLEALAASTYGRYPLASALALRVLRGESTIDYEILPSEWLLP